MSVNRISLNDLIFKGGAKIEEHEIWCMLYQSSLALHSILSTDSGCWENGPTLLITPETVLIDTEGKIHFCFDTTKKMHRNDDDYDDYDAPEMNRAIDNSNFVFTYKSVEKMYLYSLGMCIMTSALLAHGDDEHNFTLSSQLNNLLSIMVEENPLNRDVTFNQVQECCLDYSDVTVLQHDLSLLVIRSINIDSEDDNTISLKTGYLELDLLEAGNKHLPNDTLAKEIDQANSLSIQRLTLLEDMKAQVDSLAYKIEHLNNNNKNPTSTLRHAGSLDYFYSHICTPETRIRGSINATGNNSTRNSGLYSRHLSSSYSDINMQDKGETENIDISHFDIEDTNLFKNLAGETKQDDRNNDDVIVTAPAKHYRKDSLSSNSSSDDNDDNLNNINDNKSVSEGSTLVSDYDKDDYDDDYYDDDKFTKFNTAEIIINMNDRINCEDVDSDLIDDSNVPISDTDSQFLTAEIKSDVIENEHVVAHTIIIEPISDIEMEESIPHNEFEQRNPDDVIDEEDHLLSKNFDEKILANEEEFKNNLNLETIETYSQNLTDINSQNESQDAENLQIIPPGTPLMGNEMLTLVQALQDDTFQEQLTPTTKMNYNRLVRDPSVFIFEPTYDEDWQNIENSKESMNKLRKLLGPDFERLSGGNSEYTESTITGCDVTEMKLPQHRKIIEVILLNSRKISAMVDDVSLVQDLFLQVVSFLSLQEPLVFGLTIIRNGEEVFLDLKQQVIKYAPKGWIESAKNSGITDARKPLRKFTVFFRVRYWVENVRLLNSIQTKHFYYLQLKKDFLEGRKTCHEESDMQLSALTLQAELGDYQSEINFEISDYISQRCKRKFSAKTANNNRSIRDLLIEQYETLSGLSRTEAELQYLKEAQKLPDYGIVYYRVSKTKRHIDNSEDQRWLGLSARGVVLCTQLDELKVPISAYPWKLIQLMWYRNRKFIIEPNPELNQKPIFIYAESYKHSKYLLRLSQEFHKFQMLTRTPIGRPMAKGIPMQNIISDLMIDSHYQDVIPNYIYSHSSRGSLSTIQSDPYVPMWQGSSIGESDSIFADILPLPTGIDIPTEPGLVLMSVVLKHSAEYGFGMTIMLNPMNKPPGLYIQTIHKSGPACQDGRLKVNDKIMAVNGYPITKTSYKDVLSLLQSASVIEMIVETQSDTPPQPLQSSNQELSEYFELTLTKSQNNEDFGFDIIDSEYGIIVSKVNSSVSDLLQVGDKITEINSVRLVSLKCAEVYTLMEAFNEIKFKLIRFNSEDKQSPIPAKDFAELLPNSENNDTLIISDLDDIITENYSANLSIPILPTERDFTPTTITTTPPNIISRNFDVKIPHDESVPDESETFASQISTELPATPPGTPVNPIFKGMNTYAVYLQKMNGTFGMNLDIYSKLPYNPVSIKFITKGSPADECGIIHSGDQIISVMNQNLLDMDSQEILKYITTLPDNRPISFQIVRYTANILKQVPDQITPPQEVEFTDQDYYVNVNLFKTQGNIGLQIKVIKEPSEFAGVYIREVLPNSPAAKFPELHKGAKLISINGQSLLGVNKLTAMHLLKNSQDPIQLQILPAHLISGLELHDSESELLTPEMNSNLSEQSLSLDDKDTTVNIPELFAIVDQPDVIEEYLSIDITRGHSGLGLKVVPKLQEMQGLIIKDIIFDPALSDGRLLPGDEIISIDDINIQTMPKKESLELLRGPPETPIRLYIKRFANIFKNEENTGSLYDEVVDSQEKTSQEGYDSNQNYSRLLPEHNLIEHVFLVNLVKKSDERLGIHLGHYSLDEFPNGIYVKRFSENSIAMENGLIREGDIILEVNGIDLRQKPKDEAVECIKEVRNNIRLLIARYDPYEEIGDSNQLTSSLNGSISSQIAPPEPTTAPPSLLLLSSQDFTLAQQEILINNTEDSGVEPIKIKSTISQFESMPFIEYDSFEFNNFHALIPKELKIPTENFYLRHLALQLQQFEPILTYAAIELNWDYFANSLISEEIQRINEEMIPESVEEDFLQFKSSKPQYDSNIGRLPFNLQKNRNIRSPLPYDRNIITLLNRSHENSYINASLVQIAVNEIKFKYICTQAPFPSGVGDFWQMVWDNDMYVIVMLVEQREHGLNRCPPYWSPSQNSELRHDDQMDFGDFSVILVEETEKNTTILRSLLLKYNSTGDERHIMHFTYKLWSGIGIPKSVQDFCDFVQLIRCRVLAKQMIIHCNTGAGRTGTFCMVDIISECLERNLKINISQLASSLNNNRMNMIKSIEQYKFGYSICRHFLFNKPEQ